jgi:hypothetical protein
MIQLRADIAWVRHDDGRAVPLDAAQLAAELRVAAAQAGEADWWLAEAVAAAVQRFVGDEVADRVVAVRDLHTLLVALLITLGYAPVAAVYAGRHLRAEIRLDELAAQSAGGFELAFFRQLDTVLQGANGFVQMRGLRSCVMQLRGARHWSAGCRRLAEEIVGYVRHRLAQQAAPVRLCLGD